MSRFANESLTRTISLGPCQCPGSPHQQDEAIAHVELGYGARVAAQVAGSMPNGSFNMEAAKLRLLELTLISWNLLGPDGTPVEVSERSIGLLDPDTILLLQEETAGVIKRAAVPKASAGPSGSGTPATGSPTPETATPTSSTSTSS